MEFLNEITFSFWQTLCMLTIIANISMHVTKRQLRKRAELDIILFDKELTKIIDEIFKDNDTANRDK